MPPTLPPARCALTAPFHPCRPILLRGLAGGLLSVALSLGSPPPDVIRRRVSVEPGLSSARKVEPASDGRPAGWPPHLGGGQVRVKARAASPEPSEARIAAGKHEAEEPAPAFPSLRRRGGSSVIGK